MIVPDLQVLFDVDNTLLDNDAFATDLDRFLRRCLGQAGAERYWKIHEELRESHGYVDYLETLQRERDAGADPIALSEVADYLLAYPFAERLYPGALQALAHVASLAPVALLSDGDIVFQPRKIRRSGLEEAVACRVLICVHKDAQLEELQRRFPARHYAMVDDKPALLARMKARLGASLTTIWVRQGHYAREGASEAIAPAPDRCVDAIAQLLQFRREDLHAGATDPATT